MSSPDRTGLAYDQEAAKGDRPLATASRSAGERRGGMAHKPARKKNAGSPPKTKKEARRRGCRTFDECVVQFEIPCENARPIVVKGEEFFKESDCERLASRTTLLEQGMFPAPGAEPAVRKYLLRAKRRYDVYRMSDAVPLPKKRAILNAVLRVTPEVGRLDRPSWKLSGHEEEMLQHMERGIRFAYTNKHLKILGRMGKLVVYVDGRCFYRSRSVPRRRRRIPPTDVVRVVADYSPEPPKWKAPQLDDALEVLRTVPDCTGFVDIEEYD